MSTTVSIHHAVEIDISDITSDTSANIGLYSGVFRWVTERPGYDGVTVVPTDEDATGGFATVWKEGIITDRASIGQANRIINILASGDYGTLSGFTLKVNNTSIDGTGSGDKFSDALFDNDYFLINRKVKYYIVIDDVFYYAWSGIVTKTSYNETEYSIRCEDDSKTIHKPFPPNTITKRQFENLQSKSEGKSIPVSMGFVDNAKLLNISVQNDAIDVASKNGNIYKTATIRSYDSVNKTLVFESFDLFFNADELQGFFIRHIVGGDDQVLKILSNIESTNIALGTAIAYATEVTLENVLTQTPNTGASDGRTRSFIEIFNYDSFHIVSNKEIEEYYQGEEGSKINLKTWNEDLLDWVNVSEITDLYDTADLSNIGLSGAVYPGVKVLSKLVNYDGDYNKTISLTPSRASLQYVRTYEEIGGDILEDDQVITTDFTLYADDESIRDNSKSSPKEIEIDVDETQIEDNSVMITFLFKNKIRDNIKITDYENIYMLIDMDVKSDKNIDLYAVKYRSRASSDIYQPVTLINPTITFNTSMTPDVYEEIRFIPGNHYNDSYGNTTLFEDNKANLSSLAFYDKSKIFRSWPYIDVFPDIEFRNLPSSQTTKITFKIYEIALVVEILVNVTSEDLYTKIQGEYFRSTSPEIKTDNVYYIFRHILENYDLLTSADLEYNDLGVNRISWPAGRQITKKENSKKYLQELARQSFVGIYPTRKGKRGLKAFRDDTTFSSVQHFSDNGNIIVDSISRFELSDINQVYNDFDIKYDYNPAKDDFEQSIFIHKADSSAFPGRFVSNGTDSNKTFLTGTVTIKADGTSYITLTFGADPTWATVGEFASINDASPGLGAIEFGTITRKTTTEIDIEFNNLIGALDGDTTTTTTVISHGSGRASWKDYVGGYTEYNKASSHWTVCHNSYERTGRLNQLPDSLSNCKWFVEESKFNINSPGDNSSAHKYLEQLIEWTTRQKEIVEYQIPLTTTNLQLELLTALQFKDQKYTNGDVRQGYITKTKINPALDTMTIEATLEPADIDDVTSCDIQETGFGDDIQETGSQTDDIQETGLC
jgi:hypothetical protein